MKKMNPCKICGVSTQLITSFGKMPRANALLSHLLEEEFFYDLDIVFCPECFMVQLNQCVEPVLLFNKDYAFISSTSQAMVRHFKQISQDIVDGVSSKHNPFIVELGCNDGVMLQHIVSKGIKHVGIEPSSNVAVMARNKGVNVIERFFNQNTAQEILDIYGPADIICGSNVTCHIEDINSVFSGAHHLLKDDGVFFFEDPYLLDIVKLGSFDQIYDAHIYLFSGHSISYLANKHNLELVGMKHQNVHGGSMRYFLKKRKGHLISPHVEHYLSEEKKYHLDDYFGYQEFSEKIDKICSSLKDTLSKIKGDGFTIAGYGATAKSSTVLNYAKIGCDLIDYICDVTPTKINKFTPGMHIPIKSHEYFLTHAPDCTLLLAWNHKEEILTKEQAYIDKGGKFITYFPTVLIT